MTHNTDMAIRVLKQAGKDPNLDPGTRIRVVSSTIVIEDEIKILEAHQPALSFRYEGNTLFGVCSCGEWIQRGGSPTWVFVEWWKHCSKIHQDEPNVLKPYREKMV